MADQPPIRRRRRPADAPSSAPHAESSAPPAASSSAPSAARRRRALPPESPEPAASPRVSAASPSSSGRRSRRLVRRRLLRRAAEGLIAFFCLLSIAADHLVRRILALLDRAFAHPHAGSRRLLRSVLFVVLASVALFSLVMLLGIGLRSLRTRTLSSELSALHGSAPSVAQAQPSAAESFPLPTSAPLDEQALIERYALHTPLPTSPASPSAAPSSTPAPTPVSFYTIGGSALPEMVPLHERNHDLIGWLEIPGVVDLPVVYRNNSFYLNHDFDQQKSASGTLFLDEAHPLRASTQNLLIHGHNMKDGTMFGHLTRYLSEGLSYLKSHPLISFSTLWEQHPYVVVSVMRVSLSPESDSYVPYYLYPTFPSQDAFSSYIRRVQLASRYEIPVDVLPTDALLTLSTCMEEDRLVIIARRMRPDETRDRLRSLVNLSVHR